MILEAFFSTRFWKSLGELGIYFGRDLESSDCFWHRF